ncbi:riboflavin biosynthesis protein RibF [Furfurilactobacillus sp. WILCCON 0119]|uniref:riboflavin biosynthesis protein RibF n=1 Tax=Furfurilactobacillus entadae TaxID=2922307 RepID=UPI0035E4F07B
MQVIYLRQPYQQAQIPDTPVVLAMGFFDGVHLGHQTVINRARKLADERGVKLAVLTYTHQPALVYQNNPEVFRYLSRFDRKLALLKQLGVDIVYGVSFTSQLSALQPQTFVDDYMVGLHAVAVVAGFDHTYGKVDVASMKQLPAYANGRFDVVEVGQVSVKDAKDSSTRIRQAIDDGDVADANQLLGYTYQTTGIVVHGEARGRTLGYPTANIDPVVTERLPGIGIYAVWLKLGDVWYPGMASIGRNETFGDHRPVTIEINLLDFDQQIYGEEVVVAWGSHLRDQVKFSGVDDLVAQLDQDALATRAFMADHAKPLETIGD